MFAKKHMWICLFCIALFSSCASTGVKTISFYEYKLDPGPLQTKKNANVEITIKTISLSDFYKYPKLFSFDLNALPDRYKKDAQVRSEYEPDENGRSWEYPFATPDGTEMLMFCYCKVKNNTDHILRMGDARIYFVTEDYEPIPAISSVNELLEQADYFEEQTNIVRTSKTFLYVIQVPPLPAGFFRAIVRNNIRAYKLINDLKYEILPGFTYEGILAFPAVPSVVTSAKISFFDVTISTDKAGNATEKTRFDFDLKSESVNMYYDRDLKKWITGAPPVVTDMKEENAEEIEGENNQVQEQKAVEAEKESKKNAIVVLKIVVVNVNAANIRKGPTKDDPVIKTVPSGMTLKVIGSTGDWYEVIFGDNDSDKGYIFKTLVKDE